MQLIVLIIISISLSMDAFSLALVYGLQNMNKKDQYVLSLIVGIYHFIMPQISNLFGEKIFSLININLSFICFIILFIIGLEMILSKEDSDKAKELSLKNYLFFGLAVSIDSFSLGLGLDTIYSNKIVASSVFMLISAFFTYLGLILGNKINHIIGKISTTIGGVILMIIAIIYLI